ncbi:hypothetical protein D6810_00605, partial [Candidatus Dojkabacteria bacterium]
MKLRIFNFLSKRFIFILFSPLFASLLLSLNAYTSASKKVTVSLNKVSEVQPIRGEILDRNGYRLAYDELSYVLYVSQPVAGLDKCKNFESHNPCELIRGNSKDVIEEFVLNNSINESNLIYREEPIRVYPYGSSLFHFLGYLTRNEKGERIGAKGIEKIYNEIL